MCQCQEATISPYPSYNPNPYPYDPYVSYEANRYPYPPYDPNPYPYYGAVPYPVYPMVTYDPYWPSRVTPSNRPLLLVPPFKRFRGEVRAGNCLVIVE
jgi:hypothetical protein